MEEVPTYYNLSNALTRLIEDAKDTAQIAERLNLFKVKGVRGSSTRCPLARYLRKVTSDGSVVVSYTEAFSIGRSQEVKLPALLREFVGMFDAGRFPELEDKVIDT